MIWKHFSTAFTWMVTLRITSCSVINWQSHEALLWNAFSNFHWNNPTRLFYPQTKHHNKALSWSNLGKLECFIITLGQNKELDCWSKVAKFLKEPKQKIKDQYSTRLHVTKTWRKILFTITLPNVVWWIVQWKDGWSSSPAWSCFLISFA